jgi:hypothetical protein
MHCGALSNAGLTLHEQTRKCERELEGCGKREVEAVGEDEGGVLL